MRRLEPCYDSCEGQVAKARDYEHLHQLQSKQEANDDEDDDDTSHDAMVESISTSLRSAGIGDPGPRVTMDRRAALKKKGVRELSSEALLKEILQKPCPFAKSDVFLKFTKVNRNLAPAVLMEKALAKEKGTYLMASGALATLSGAKTGRSPKDKRIVKDETAEDVWWGKGSPNVPIAEENFIRNRERALDYLHMLDEVYVFDGYAGWELPSRVSIRVVCGRAYHALFMHNMLIRPTAEELKSFKPDVTILNAGTFPANRYTHGCSKCCSLPRLLYTYEDVHTHVSCVLVVLHLGRRLSCIWNRSIMTRAPQSPHQNHCRYFTIRRAVYLSDAHKEMAWCEEETGRVIGSACCSM